MDIGALRNRLDLQSPTDTVDAAGQPTRTWGTYATVWGSITPTSSAESQLAMQQVGSITHKITIRYQAAVTIMDRVSFDSRLFNIKGIRKLDERKIEMAIDAEEGL